MELACLCFSNRIGQRSLLWPPCAQGGVAASRPFQTRVLSFRRFLLSPVLRDLPSPQTTVESWANAPAASPGLSFQQLLLTAAQIYERIEVSVSSPWMKPFDDQISPSNQVISTTGFETQRPILFGCKFFKWNHVTTWILHRIHPFPMTGRSF